MKVYSIWNQKGGCSKSTLAVNTAYHLSSKGRTVLIDGDQQGNASLNYLRDKTPEYELVDVLKGDAQVEDALTPIKKNLYMLPTINRNGSILKNYGETQLMSEPFIFEDLNDELRKIGIDYVIYDLSPGLSSLERSVLMASHEIVSPLLPEAYSLSGIQNMVYELNKINKSYRKSIRITKVVISNVNGAITLHRQIRDEIMQFEGLDFFVVPQDAAIKYAQMEGVSIFEYQGKRDKAPGLSKSVTPIRELAEAMV